MKFLLSKFYTIRDDYKREHPRKRLTPQLVLRIANEIGKSPYRVAMDYASISRGPGKLTFHDYMFYRLFDEEMYDHELRMRFVSETIYFRLLFARLDMTWWAAVEDKWLLYSLLEHHGLPTPRTLAIVGNGGRSYGRVPVIGTAKETESFLRSDLPFPLFLKPVKGVGSSGALLVRGISDGEVELEGNSSLPVSDFFHNAIGSEPYLVQQYVPNHPEIATLSHHLATVRCYNFIINGQLRVESALIKLAGRGNIADNYWRDGNMLAAVDPSDGRLTRVVTGSGLSLRTLDAHPESGHPFGEVRLPCWQEVMALNERCAWLYSQIEYSSTDIAITPDGPVVIEVNFGGAFTLPQLASGQGFLSNEVANFFGIKLKS